jgi:UDPglucose 6-dehydrogenase
MRPERIILGCAQPAAPVHAQLRAVLDAFDCPLLPMRYESAELAKISINCCLVASIAVANTLSELCERAGADWAEIAPALKLDRRIGAHAYLAPGLGIAGGNLERDLATILGLSEATGSEASVIRAFVTNSGHRRDWAMRVLHDEVLASKADAVIGILGLAYKENTHSTKNSPSLALIACLTPWRLKLYDPVVPASAANHPRAEAASGALVAVAGVDALAIMTPWPAFRELDPCDLARAMAGPTVLDPYRVLDQRAVSRAGLDYFTLGMLAARSEERRHA